MTNQMTATEIANKTIAALDDLSMDDILAMNERMNDLNADAAKLANELAELLS